MESHPRSARYPHTLPLERHRSRERRPNGVGSIVWDFTTADLNETFEYTFDANLGWTDVINKKIAEVTDSNGNTVYDDKSVSITLSLKNHKPVVVSHLRPRWYLLRLLWAAIHARREQELRD